MKAKIFNIDGKAAIAIKLEAESIDEAYLCGSLGIELRGGVALLRLNAGGYSNSHEVAVTPGEHRNPKMQATHKFIMGSFNNLNSGDKVYPDEILAAAKMAEPIIVHAVNDHGASFQCVCGEDNLVTVNEPSECPNCHRIYELKQDGNVALVAA